MRRVFAMLLALAMVFSMAGAALAAETATEDYRSESKTADITIKKLYEVNGSDNDALYPQETLTFTSTPDGSNPDIAANLTIAPLEVKGNENQTLTITLPVYSKVGTYKYTITETTEKEMQGVTYSEAAIAVTVLVTYDYDNKCLATQIVLSTEDGEGGKVDTFVNQYDVGTLTLEKTVTGNLGDKDTYFDITVTFTSSEEVASDIPVTGGSHTENAKSIATTDWTKAEGAEVWTCTKTFKLKDSDKLTFADIPAGITYAVEEDARHGVGEDGFDVNSSGDTDYTVTYVAGTGTIDTDTAIAAKVCNEKKTTVETGVLLDSMPYVLMLTAAAAGLAVLLGRKKRYEA